MDLSNYGEKKADLKGATDVDTLNLATKLDLACFNTEVEQKMMMLTIKQLCIRNWLLRLISLMLVDLFWKPNATLSNQILRKTCIRLINSNLAGFFRGAFWGGSRIKSSPPDPCLELVRIMLQTSNLARKYTHICSFRKFIREFTKHFQKLQC